MRCIVEMGEHSVLSFELLRVVVISEILIFIPGKEMSLIKVLRNAFLPVRDLVVQNPNCQCRGKVVILM